MLRAARFLAAYLGPARSGAEGEPAVVDLGDGSAPGLLFRPAGGGPYPGWVLLHGITVPGVRHPAILRFARALSGSGAVVLLPEVEAWTRLRIDPARSEAVIGAAARALASRPDVRPGGVGVLGFSFGATQAVAAAARPEVGAAIRSVVGFGGYCDLRRTLDFMMAGEHEWDGVRYRTDPDPYGRWIVAANYLTRVPEHAGRADVAEAARALAAEAGRRFVFAGDPSYDGRKAELRRGLDPAGRRLWDLLAPPAGVAPDRDAALHLSARVAAAATRADPALDPTPLLPRLDRRVTLVHGRDDQLVPFTETLRLASRLPPAADAGVTITRLFAHSKGAGTPGWGALPGEAWRFVRLLDRALG